MVSISLCMIVKNEEDVLARALDSVKELADEIIIVDTGSEDRTKDIARRYTQKVFDFEWEDDFAAGAQVGAIGIDELAHKDIGVFNRHGGKHLIVLEGEQIAGDLVDAEKEADESRQQKADGQKQLQHTQGLQTLGYEKGV